MSRSANNGGVSNNNNGNIRRSFIGSLKNHFSRRSTADDDDDDDLPSPSVRAPRRASVRSAHTSSNTNTNARASANRVSAPLPPANTDRSPLANPSPATRRPFQEPPPPYEAIPPTISRRAASPAPSHGSGASRASRLTMQDVTTTEDPYAFLSAFDTIFVIDDSGSMAGRSWRELRAVLANITPICTAHDADGIDLYFLNHRSPHPAPGPGKASGGYNNVRDVATVNRIFDTVRPGASTPTGTRIDNILRPYLRHYKEMIRQDPDEPNVKPVNMIVITDGVPTDELDSVLYSAAQRLDQLDAPPVQVGIQFFQVGNEPGAAQYLRELDDNLSSLISGSGVRDIVDTVTWDFRSPTTSGSALTADGILKAVLGAVIKRLDRIPTGHAPIASPVRGSSRPPSIQFLAVP